MWAYGEIMPGGPIIDTYAGAVIVNGREVSLDMWDTRGCGDRLRPLTYPHTDVFVICFSVVHPWSREDVVTKWVSELERHGCFSSECDVFIVGTQTQLRRDDDTIRRLEDGGEMWNVEDTRAWAEGVLQSIRLNRTVRCAQYFECSAYSGEGVQNILDHATRDRDLWPQGYPRCLWPELRAAQKLCLALALKESQQQEQQVEKQEEGASCASKACGIDIPLDLLTVVLEQLDEIYRETQWYESAAHARYLAVVQSDEETGDKNKKPSHCSVQ